MPELKQITTSAADSQVEEAEQILQTEIGQTAVPQIQPAADTTTLDVLGIRALGPNGLVAHANNSYAIVRSLDAMDATMASGPEKRATVNYGASWLNSLSRPVAFYLVSEEGSMDGYLAELEAKRQTVPKGPMRRLYRIEEDDIGRLAQTNGITDRAGYIAFGATQAERRAVRLAEVKASDGQSSDAPADDESEKRGLRHWIEQRNKELFEPKDVTSTHDKTRGKSYIPPVIADSLGFAVSSASDAMGRVGMNMRVLKDSGLANQLARRLGSPYANDSRTEDNRRQLNQKMPALDRIGSVEFKETSSFVRFRNLENGQKRYAAGLYVTGGGFPRNMTLGTLYPIVRMKNIQMQIGLHVTPWEMAKAQKKAKSRQELVGLAEMKDTSSTGDMVRQNRYKSLIRLRDKMARGDGKIFKVGLRIAVIAPTTEQLRNDLRQVQQRLQEIGFSVAVATRQHRKAFLSTLPTGRDWLSEGAFQGDRTQHSNMFAENIMCLIPNVIPDFRIKGGIIVGINHADNSLINYNRWKQVNPHCVVVATTGAGKSVSMLGAEVYREMIVNPEMQIFYIDPQGMLTKFAALVGGVTLDMSRKGGQIINPLDRYILNGQPGDIGDLLSNYLYPLFELMLRQEITAADRTSIKDAVERLYYHYERGDSCLHVLAQSFSIQRKYTACRPYLNDWQDEQGQWHAGIINRLHAIYAELIQKHAVPSTGMVAGNAASKGNRPVTHFDKAECRFYYVGEGVTNAPLPATAFEAESKYAPIPPAVWYPDEEWVRGVFEDFNQLVQTPDEYGHEVFWMFDYKAKKDAIRDAFVELERGMPILASLMPFLAAEGLTYLVDSLDNYISPIGEGKIFNGYTNVRLDGRFIGFDLSGVESKGNLRSIRMFQIIYFVWQLAQALPRMRGIWIDEFAYMIRNFPDVGALAADCFQRGRFYYFTMTVIVQELSALLNYETGNICLDLADRIVLLRQQEVATDKQRDKLKITQGQAEYLTKCRDGDGIQRIDNRWVTLKYYVPEQILTELDTRPQAAQQAGQNNEDD